ncbi:MAG: preprotein translocase subunit SecG [Nitrospinaceae bacterium]|nr:preprotein translocase subunit SecG [Nitrospinaceae bacterium]MDP7149018.1 preprotein translocase subunit SecG [Nitrospinaceae bacterium]|tara:strand:- start:54 stop:377 length:324 start_codon:yes stop_codon:yes gene_type:complete
MHTLIIMVHVICTLFLILVILLQTGKGAGMGSGLGAGSNQTMFGSSGASNFLTKMTTAIATLFMITSLTLATMSSKEKSRSIMPETEVPAAASSAPPVPEAGDEKSE